MSLAPLLLESNFRFTPFHPAQHFPGLSLRPEHFSSLLKLLKMSRVWKIKLNIVKM